MIVLIAALMALRQADTGFRYGMPGIYSTKDGTPIVVQDTHHANAFYKEKFYQVRAFMFQENRKYFGDVYIGNWLLGPQKADSESPIGVWIDHYAVGDNAGYRKLDTNGYFQVTQFWGNPSTQNSQGFDFEILGLGMTPIWRDTANKCGDLEDIEVGGDYNSADKSTMMSIKETPAGEFTHAIAGTISYNGLVLHFKGLLGLTHGYWSAEKGAAGFIEWAPTPNGIPKQDKAWKPADRIYFMANAGALGAERVSMYLSH